MNQPSEKSTTTQELANLYTVFHTNSAHPETDMGQHHKDFHQQNQLNFA